MTKNIMSSPSKSAQDYIEHTCFPGQYPFTRGIYPNMYSGRLWTMRQYAGFGTAEETNKRYKLLLAKGQKGLSVAFDLPTQMGYDADDERAKGEVGKAGVSISSIADMEHLFNHISLNEVSVSMTINATAPIILAMYIAVAEKRGIKSSQLSGTVQNDILKEFIARGCYIFPPEPSMKLAVDVMEYCLENMPRWNFISVSGYHIREAGATAAQELGFTLANAICYVEKAKKRGLDVNKVGQRISFFFNAHNNFFEEVAKFRAARMMWARIMKNRFGATDERALQLRFHTQTAGSALTAQQPENNIARVTLQALSSVLGGTQSLHTNAFDEALSLPTDKSATIALRTQQVIANETDIPTTIDPLGGSYYLEKITNEMEAKANRYINEISRYGCAIEAIKQKYHQKEIESSAVRQQNDVESGKSIIVGVNKFQENRASSTLPQSKADASLKNKCIANIKRIRKIRNNNAVQLSINKLLFAISSNKNTVPAIVDCVKNYVTIGEICNLLRKEYGEYDQSKR